MTTYSTKKKLLPNAYLWLFRFSYSSLPRVFTLFLHLRTGLEKVVLKQQSHWCIVQRQTSSHASACCCLVPGALWIYFVQSHRIFNDEVSIHEDTRLLSDLYLLDDFSQCVLTLFLCCCARDNHPPGMGLTHALKIIWIARCWCDTMPWATNIRVRYASWEPWAYLSSLCPTSCKWHVGFSPVLRHIS